MLLWQPFYLPYPGLLPNISSNASITATLEPISAGIIAALFLGEVMVPFQIMGGLIVIGSIVILQLNTADR
jgi:drug/metabolite transporter (DMT)-like permease